MVDRERVNGLYSSGCATRTQAAGGVSAALWFDTLEQGDDQQARQDRSGDRACAINATEALDAK